tara:strand:- start:3825 stop:4013 length:189 start_codon:yes stop_codon:yes gene_type:complete
MDTASLSGLVFFLQSDLFCFSSNKLDLPEYDQRIRHYRLLFAVSKRGSYIEIPYVQAQTENT